MDKEKKCKRQALLSSFRNAGYGIWIGLKNERNMKIHFIVMGVVIMMGTYFGITSMEWCVCLILFGMVIGAELINCAVEALVDLVVKEYHPLARIAKDTAAGAVLVCAIIASIIGVIIFGPEIGQAIRQL